MSENHLLSVEIRPSSLFILFLTFIHALAALSVVLLPYATLLEVLTKPLLFFLIIVSYVYYYKKTRNIIIIAEKPDNRWDLIRSDGFYRADNLIKSIYSSDWLVILAFSGGNRRGRDYVYLIRNSIDVSVLSELKCRLKTEGLSLFKHNSD